MTRRQEVPDLLKQFMEASGSKECWITVRELRLYFQLDESAGPALSGFLQKIHHGSFQTCRYKVARMEKFRDTTPPYRIIKRYLIQKRPAHKGHQVSDTQQSVG